MTRADERELAAAVELAAAQLRKIRRLERENARLRRELAQIRCEHDRKQQSKKQTDTTPK